MGPQDQAAQQKAPRPFPREGGAWALPRSTSHSSLSRPEWCLCRSAAVYGITYYNPASLLSYPVISNVEN